MEEPTISVGRDATQHSLPTEARAVIIGGGIVGTSVAYHLAGLGWTDVVVLEQSRLAGGTTWHSAGMVGRLRTSNSLTKINKYSAELYASLEEETGVPTGWNQVGSVIVARSEDRMEQLRRTANMSERFGVEVELIDVDRIAELWPLVRTDDLLGGVWLPGDGKLKPDQITLALAKGAENRGVSVFENAQVVDVEVSNGRATGVRTTSGSIATDVVVICGGMWSRQFAKRAGVTLPLYPVEHHYVVSEPIVGVHDDLPVGRDPDLMIYFRSEAKSIMLGAFQKLSNPWMVDAVPDKFSFELLRPDWEKFHQPLNAGVHRIPALGECEFPRFVNGPESFTPDNSFLLGETPEVRSLFVAAGFNSVGIASGGGAGKTLAEWIDGGEAPMDLWSVDVRRFAPFHNNTAFLRERTAEVLGLHYQMAWPNREMETGRGIRRSALHGALEEAGACFGSKMGWERANWFAPSGQKPRVEYSFGRQNWFEHSADEHRAARENVAIFDQSSFSKYMLAGRDALSVLQTICGADVDVEPGQLVYTGLFNQRGTFESDLTVARLAEDRFYIVTATSQTVHDADWIRRHIPSDAAAYLTDVTSSYGVIGLMGPRARRLLSRVTDADVSNEAFPFGTFQDIGLGVGTGRALRVTYVGELGWEIHVPTEFMLGVFEALWEAGHELGLRNAGQYAINSLRLEKAYRAWGHDISPDDTPIEAGLSFAVAWKKPVSFIGRDALLAQKESGVNRRLVAFVLDDPEPVLWGSEPIFRDGVPVGYTTSGAYGHTLGAAVGMGYVNRDEPIDAAYIRSGSYEIQVGAQSFSARPFLRSPYDADRQKILC